MMLEKPSEIVPLKHWMAIFGAILGAFMAILDIQITNASIQQIAGALSIPLDESNNISTAYLIAELICIPMTAWLSSVFSFRRLLVVTTIVFTLSSLLCSIAWNLPSMVIFRAIQGFAGAPFIPMALTMVMRFLPESKRMIGMALFGLTATFAPTIGPALGGWLTDNFSWKYLFYINVIPGIIVVTLLLNNLDKAPIDKTRLRQFDLFGVVMMAVGLGFLEYVLEKGNTYNWFSSSYIITLSVIAAVALIFFFVNDFYSEHPLLNLRLLAGRRFGIGCICFFFFGVVLYGVVFIVPLYLIQIQHYSALSVGKLFFWQGLPQLVFMPLIPAISQRIDNRILVAIGCLLMAASCFTNAWMDPDFSGPQMEVSMLIRGLSMPFAMVPLSAVILRDISQDNMASASSITNVVRNLGGAFGIAFITTMVVSGGSANTTYLSGLLSSTSVAGWWRLHNDTQLFMQKGANAYTASQQAHLMLQQHLQENGTIIAFNNIYFLLGISMIGCALAMVAFFDFKKRKNTTIGQQDAKN